MILFLEKYFLICKVNKILLVFCLKVVLLVKICCLINCWVNVELLEELLIFVVLEINVWISVFGIILWCFLKYLFFVEIMVFFSNGDIWLLLICVWIKFDLMLVIGVLFV